MDARQGLAAILRDARKSALLRMRLQMFHFLRAPVSAAGQTTPDGLDAKLTHFRPNAESGGRRLQARKERCMLMVRHLCFLACVVPAISLSHGDSASAARIGRDAGPARPFAGRPFGPRAGGAPHTTFAG